MSDWMSRTTVDGAKQTLVATEKIIALLGHAGDADGQLVMARRQADELARFLSAHLAALKELIHEAEQSPGKDLLMQLVVARQSDVERALGFVDSAFITPRRTPGIRESLELADWMCVEGFLRYSGTGQYSKNSPIGPLVAVDARRSPAVWAPGDSLPLPSLFQRSPEILQRSRRAGGRNRNLNWFPLVCLPSNLARSPEYFPLLSHEAGHAVDEVRSLSKSMLTFLREHSHKAKDPQAENRLGYWKAWMSELVADMIGIALSGRAFTLALESYVKYMNVNRVNTDSSEYPGIDLRLKMLRAAEQSLQERRPASTPQHSGTAPKKLDETLLEEYCDLLLPHFWKLLPLDKRTWRLELEQVDTLAIELGEDKPTLSISVACSLPFHLIPSVVTLAKRINARLDTIQALERLQEPMRTTNRPEWVQTSSTWRFHQKTLPAIRPTMLSTDGETKIPPVNLLQAHDSIVFLGATNGQLCSRIKQAMKKRSGIPWKSLEVFFCDDQSLEFVERYEPNLVASDKLKFLKNERNRSINELRRLFETTAPAAHWSLRMYSNRGLFGAYYDWEQPGGRIHSSTQLHGIDLRKCPGQDIIWRDETPPPSYQGYLQHLHHIRDHSTLLASGRTQSRKARP